MQHGNWKNLSTLKQNKEHFTLFSEYHGVCNSSEGTVTGIDGWWGRNSSRPTQLAQCRLEDEPTGLHWLRYRYPPDFDHPDEVSGSVALSQEVSYSKINSALYE